MFQARSFKLFIHGTRVESPSMGTHGDSSGSYRIHDGGILFNRCAPGPPITDSLGIWAVMKCG